MATYQEKLLSPKWQKKRLRILERDNFTCQLCGDTETTLHVHHFKYCAEPHLSEDSDLITYCSDCHSSIEYLKKEGYKERFDIGWKSIVDGIIVIAAVNDVYMITISGYCNQEHKDVLMLKREDFNRLHYWVNNPCRKNHK